MSALHPNFASVIERAESSMKNYGRSVHTAKWQGIDISKRPEAQMRELLMWDFRVNMPTEDLEHYRLDIKPNLPWADNHFGERVCGFPMNPGKEWANWPYAHSADKFRDAKGRFEVNYMERFWASGEFEDTPKEGQTGFLSGIRGRPYGDLNDIVQLLVGDPLTRQAYLPIYFPEDTGAGGRVPCSLGYWWIMRDGRLDVFYAIRSCDIVRHFRDDIYLAIRLTLWLLNELRERDAKWSDVRPGVYQMWIGSLHCFVNDYIKLLQK